MKMGFIGLGRMGHAMVLHLLEQSIDVAVYNRTQQKIEELSKEAQDLKLKSQNLGKLYKTYSVEELVKQLFPPRIIWLMVPQGKPVDEIIGKLIGEKQNVSSFGRVLPRVSLSASAPPLRSSALSRALPRVSPVQSDYTPENFLQPGDIIIEGGNSFYKDSIRRYQMLKEKGIHYLDVGTSGGLEGARNGACVMVGGDRQIYEKVRPIIEKLAVHDGAAYMGPSGAGHFVKMVHNGVEYGMLEALGEGFEILFAGPYQLNFEEISKNWSHGSVVRGWLVELLERAFAVDPKLEKIEGVIGGGTTGEWTIKTAKELNVSAPVIENSLEVRKKSLSKPTFSGKVVAALRNQFGGHEIKKREG